MMQGYGTVRARAPLRLGLAGGGTDVSPYADTYGGRVLNVTINRFAFASVSPRSDGRVVFAANDRGVTDELDIRDFPFATDAGMRLHRAAYNRLISDFADGDPRALTLTTHVDSPIGAGLGSSSSLVVAMVEALKEALGAPLGEYDVARLATQIERRDVGLHGGRQDQYAATFGGFNFMEFEDNERVVVNPLRIKQAIWQELEASMLLFYTGVSRDSSSIIDSQTAAISEGGPALEAMHVIRANAMEMKEALLFGNLRTLAEILDAGWQAKKRTAGLVSNSTIERVIDGSRDHGCLAGRVSGAGGGGFVLLYVDPLRRAEVIRYLQQEVEGRVSGCSFSGDGAVTWRA